MRRTSERGSFSGGFTGCFGVLAAVVVVVVVVVSLAKSGSPAAPLSSSSPSASAPASPSANPLAKCSQGRDTGLVGLGGSLAAFSRYDSGGLIQYTVWCWPSTNLIAFIEERLPTPVPVANLKASVIFADPAVGLAPGDSVVLTDSSRKDCELVSFRSDSLQKVAPASYAGTFNVSFFTGNFGTYDASAVDEVRLDASGLAPGEC